jgi:hypothetical protein
MLKRLSGFVMVGALLGCLSAAPAQALPNLVRNGGFELGNFTGWTLAGNTGATFVESNTVHTGGAAVALGPVGYNGILSQQLSTVVGDSYQVSFWFLQPTLPPNLFQASFDGKLLMVQRNTRRLTGNWVQYIFDVTATSAMSLLEFRFRDDPGYEYLDDIAVCDVTPAKSPPVSAPVPEPGSALLVGSGLLGLGFWLRRRRGH